MEHADEALGVDSVRTYGYHFYPLSHLHVVP